MGMTVRELINALLDKRMDAEVLLRTPDPQRPDVVGVNFHIEEVLPSTNNPEILFEDWRDVFDKREVTE